MRAVFKTLWQSMAYWLVDWNSYNGFILYPKNPDPCPEEDGWSQSQPQYRIVGEIPES